MRNKLIDYRFICTFSVSEVLYRAQTILAERGDIEVTGLTAPFWSDLLGYRVPLGHISRAPTLEDALKALQDVADAFFRAGSEWVTADGSMSEQINR
jgi:hypothetical protein